MSRPKTANGRSEFFSLRITEADMAFIDEQFRQAQERGESVTKRGVGYRIFAAGVSSFVASKSCEGATEYALTGELN